MKKTVLWCFLKVLNLIHSQSCHMTLPDLTLPQVSDVTEGVSAAAAGSGSGSGLWTGDSAPVLGQHRSHRSRGRAEECAYLDSGILSLFHMIISSCLDNKSKGNDLNKKHKQVIQKTLCQS